MEKQPTLEHLKTINPNKLGSQVLKSADVMLEEYIKIGGTRSRRNKGKSNA